MVALGFYIYGNRRAMKQQPRQETLRIRRLSPHTRPAGSGTYLMQIVFNRFIQLGRRGSISSLRTLVLAAETSLNARHGGCLTEWGVGTVKGHND